MHKNHILKLCNIFLKNFKKTIDIFFRMCYYIITGKTKKPKNKKTERGNQNDEQGSRRNEQDGNGRS